MNKKNKIPNIPRKHHYVQQSYLSNWYNGDKFKVLYLNSNRIWDRTTNQICFEDYFYKMSRLNRDEIDFLLNKIYASNIILDSAPILKVKMKELITLHYNDIIVESKDAEVARNVAKILSQNLEEIEDSVFKKSGELFIGDIEKSLSNDFWHKLYSKDKAFFEDEQLRVDFYSYICAQRWRTPKMKKNLQQKIIEANEYFYGGRADLSTDRLFPYFVAFQSTIEATLLGNTNKYKLSYLTVSPNSKVSFVTSDNPVINLCDEFDDNNNPIKLEWFWPISPTVAILISSDDISKELTDDEIAFYNKMVKKEAFNYVISFNNDNLKALIS